jgi:nucleoside-diphosphate-sugar epimerase
VRPQESVTHPAERASAWTRFNCGTASRSCAEARTLSIEKASRLPGYDPKVDIEQGVPEYARMLKERGPAELRGKGG